MLHIKLRFFLILVSFPVRVQVKLSAILASRICLEAQLLNGTNASPGNWSQCGPVMKDNKGFYISKTDFTGLDHSKLAGYNPTVDIVAQQIRTYKPYY